MKGREIVKKEGKERKQKRQREKKAGKREEAAKDERNILRSTIARKAFFSK